ncbi:MAG: GNAT family N-acetyltransferase [Syntrophorhabdus sp.]|nr:GNAT family N-acetyltransferase [Syntrophorhabdus sp.]
MSYKSEYSPYLQGRRLYLREVRVSDINEEYYHWMNDPGVTRYLESRFFPNDTESLKEYVVQRQKDRNSVFLAIILKEEEKHIGNVKLGPIDWIHKLGDIGVLIGDKSSWGRGYATEAIGLVVKLAFQGLNLHKVTAGYYVDNKGSEKAFKNNGFVLEGVRRKHRFCEGSYTDTVLLGLLREEFEKKEE